MAMEGLLDDSISPPKRLKLDEKFLEMAENSFKMNAGTLDVEKNIEEGANNSESEPVAETEKISLPFTSSTETNDEDENSNDADKKSNCSSVSDISCFSNLSGQQWKPTAVDALTINWLEQQMLKGSNPRVIFNELTGDDSIIPESMSDFAIWKVIFSYLMEPPVRKRLRRITTLDHAIHLIRSCSKILVLTGAGVSVSCGIPDFRSKDGVYARLAVDFPDLPDPQSMFDISYFHRDPRPFFKFAKEIYPGQFKPSPCHRFIKHLEKHKKLLRNYTQNIDTLERVAEIENVVECHGSFATASCTICGHKVSSDEIKEEIFQQKIPYCTKCAEGIQPGIMKPDIVFFGEGLPASFHDAMGKDKDECDLLIVIGSSLKVQPVALIPSSLPNEVPQILINRERLHMNFDVELLGDSDVIVDHICRNLEGDWNELCWRDSPLSDCTDQLPPKVDTSESSDDSSSSSQQSDEEETPDAKTEVKCQKISKRHVPSDDNARHISLDSSRDSGIGEGSSNSNDSPLISLTPTINFDNSYFRLRKRRYVFPGAEVAGPHIEIIKKPATETQAS